MHLTDNKLVAGSSNRLSEVRQPKTFDILFWCQKGGPQTDVNEIWKEMTSERTSLRYSKMIHRTSWYKNLMQEKHNDESWPTHIEESYQIDAQKGVISNHCYFLCMYGVSSSHDLSQVVMKYIFHYFWKPTSPFSKVFSIVIIFWCFTLFFVISVLKDIG